MSNEIPVKEVPRLGLRLVEDGWQGFFCPCRQLKVENENNPLCTKHNRPMDKVRRGDPLDESTPGQNKMWEHEPLCFNAELNFETGKYETHALKTVRKPVVSLANKEWYMQEECKICHTAYAWGEGRAATEQELLDCSKGKIARKAEKAATHYADNY